MKSISAIWVSAHKAQIFGFLVEAVWQKWNNPNPRSPPKSHIDELHEKQEDTSTRGT